jgi:Flp pilus assembly protein TadG
MRDRRARGIRQEGGLVGKIIVVWLALLVVLGLAAFDTAQILLTRYLVADAALVAAFLASAVLQNNGDRRGALDAALAAVAEKDEGARVTEFTIDPQTQQVTVTVTKKVSTLIAGRIGFLKGFTKATESDTSELGP